jgi:hypothetical protein
MIFIELEKRSSGEPEGHIKARRVSEDAVGRFSTKLSTGKNLLWPARKIMTLSRALCVDSEARSKAVAWHALHG